MKPSRLSAADTLRVGAAGLRTRPVRVLLSALGIAIGVAAMLAVVGISTSSRADLDRSLAKLGTNLLTVTPGRRMFAGGQAKLPATAPGSVARIRDVQTVSAVAKLPAQVYRHDHIPTGQTGSIAVYATRTDLLPAVSGTVGRGAWLNEATAQYPGVVLGATAARRLDIRVPVQRVWLGGNWFSVTGILDPLPLAPELDAAALVGWPIAQQILGFDGHPTIVYTRAQDRSVEQVRALLAATINPEHPEEVRVSRPSDALAARRAADRTLGALLAGLGAVALLVGAVGVANTMVITVLERRHEIGLRRALGATRGHIRRQFLAESMLLALLGGVGGTLTGIAVTTGYAMTHGWPTVVPWWALAGGIGATAIIGPVAGLYPAVRAARMPPTTALAG
jgi:putative ABC transport system permease protein